MKKETIIKNKHVSLFLLAAALPFLARAEAPSSLSVVSAASFEAPVASGALATAFGDNLAQAAAWATFDSSGNLPTTLGGVSVTVAGLPASLLYVSPSQVNFVIPMKTPAGTEPVVLTAAGGGTATSTVAVQTVAPAIFNVTCCRFDRGAILNGVTYAMEPFSTTTSANPSSDKATILTIFGTGWRNATTATVNLTLSTGAVVPATVAYAGAAGKYVGLDQINAVVPAGLYNAGLVTVTVVANGQTAIEATTQFDEPALDTAVVPPYLISTVAGGTGEAALSAPAAVALDASHNLYIADTGNHVVRQLSTTGVLTVFAGTGTAGDSGDEGPAAKAEIQSPSGLAVDRLNNVYILDSANNRVRFVDDKGIIHAFAGTGKSGFSGDDGQAVGADFDAPSAIAADRFGNIIISDTGNNRIRKVTGDGLIHTVAGTGVQGYSGDGNPAGAAELDSPGSVSTDAEGTIYFADSQGTRVRAVDPDGNIRTIAGTGQTGNSGDAAGPLAAEFHGPLQLSTDRLNRLWIADAGNHRVRMIALDCLVHPLAGTGASGYQGDGGPATSALLTAPAGMTTDPLGNGWVADSGANNVRLLNFSTGKTNCSAAPALAFSPTVVVGGQTLTGYLELACPASAGETISLSSSLAGVVLPASVSLVTGQSIVTFPITTPETTTLQVVSVTATGPQGTSTGSFVITPDSGNGTESLTVQVSPSSAVGGQNLSGRVTIGSPAPAGGTSVSLSIDAAGATSSAAAQVVSQIVIPAGQVSEDFLIQTFAVTQNTNLTLAAKTSFATATAGFELLPSGSIGNQTTATIASLTLNPSSVESGGASTGTITLTAPAPTGGAPIAISSTAGVTTPVSILIAAGQTTGVFTITAPGVTATTTSTITATASNSVSQTLTIEPRTAPGTGEIAGLTLNPNTVTGGATSLGTVTLSAPAGANGVTVNLSGTNGASVPDAILILAGQTTGTFTVSTSPVTSQKLAVITASSQNTVTANLTINPGNTSQGQVLSLQINPSSVNGGQSSTGTVTLKAAAGTGGVLVGLSSNNGDATVPTSIIVASGFTTGTFTINTKTVTAAQSAVITATSANLVTATLTINPGGPGTGQIANVSLNPSTVTGGSPSIGTVTLTSPAGSNGVSVTLGSNSSSAAVPASIVIAAGQTGATFTVTTVSVTSQQTATITATSANSSSANLTINPGNPGTGQISSVTLNPTSVTGGATSTGTVTLSAAAGSNGVKVTLSSNNSAGTVPASITIAAGQTTGTFTVSTTSVTSQQTATITATSVNSSSANLTITPGGPGTGQISSVTLNPTSVTGGATSTGTVTLSAAAGSNGVKVTLSSNNSAGTVPASITIAAGQTTGTFTVSTTSVTSQQTATITATSANSSSANLTINPGNPGTGQISSVTLNPTSVTGGATSTGTVTLSAAAGSNGVKVTLSSNNSAGTVPASITIAAGQTTGTFTVSTTSVTSQQTATITATSANSSSANLTITPGAPGTGQISSVTLNPTSVTGGSPSTGTVTLTAAAGSNGVKVTLASNNAAATVPASIIINSGQTTGTFQVATTSVTSQQTASITATSANSSSANLTITSSSVCVSSANLVISITNLLSGQGLLSGTVVLSGPAPSGGQQIQFLSGSVNLGTITVGAGQTSAPISLSISNLVSLLPSLLTSGVSVVTNGCPLLNVTVTLNGPGAGTISSVTLNPTTVTGGATSTGTVTLSAPAGHTGVLVDLSSNNSAGTVPASITIPAGQTSGTFTVSTTSVTSQQTAIITAVSANSSSATLTINAGAPGMGQISSLALNPTSVNGGTPSTGTVTLTAAAGSSGVKVTLASNNAAATVPASIIINSGQTTGTFQVATTSVTGQQTASITATSANSTSANLTINPSTVCISTLNLNVSITNLLSGQGLLTGTVTLNGPAPGGGQQIQLLAGAVNLGTITVGAGQTTAPISLSISNLVSILGSILTSGLSAVTNGCPLLNVTVTLNGPGVGTISGITLDPTAVVGGSPSTGTVTLSAPAGHTGVLVALSSNNGAASVPASITIPAGQTNGTFQVGTSTVTSQQTATITATSANVAQAALTINTATPGQAQIVSLGLSPTSVAGGSPSTGTVTLGSPAGANGVSVTLSSNNASATVPASIVIPSGKSSGTFTVTTTSPSSQQTATITATSSNSVPATLTINPATLCVSGLTLNLSITNLLNNQGLLTGTVTLNGTAPAGGETVQLVSAGVNLGTILVPGGSLSAPISLTVANVTTILASGVNALLNGCPLLNVTVNLSGAGPASIAGLTLNPTAVTGGTSVTGTVTLASAATGSGVLVSLGSSSGSATVPTAITIPAGSTTGTFTITTAATSNGVTAVITAASGNLVTSNLAINSPCVQTLSLSVNLSQGLLNGTVALTGPAPAGGSTVDLLVGNIKLGSIFVPAGQTSTPVSLSVANLVTLLGSVVNAVLGSCPGIPITLSLSL